MTIPFQDTASFSQSMLLDGSLFYMNFNYNTGFDFWTMDLLDSNKNEIFMGAKLTTGVSIGKRLSNDLQPLGDFIVIFDSGDTPKRNDFKSNASLVYVEAL